MRKRVKKSTRAKSKKRSRCGRKVQKRKKISSKKKVRKTKKALKLEKMSKTKIKIKTGYFGLSLKKAGCLLLALVLILSQCQVLSAFEAHVVNVTATIKNDIPNANPPGGQFCDNETVTVTLSVSLPGATIWYTLDGVDPDCGVYGTEYTGPFNMPIGLTVLKARSCHDGKQSAIVSWDFYISSEYCEPQPATGLKINEVYYDVLEDPSQCVEAKSEWIELYNPTSAPINLKNWKLCHGGSCNTINPDVNIPAYGFAVVAHDNSPWQHCFFVPPEAVTIHSLGGTWVNLGNNGDYVILKNPSGNETDCVSWGNDPNTCGFPDDIVTGVDEGHSIARIIAGHDTDTASDWQDLATPNPGTNPHSVGLDELFLRPIDKITEGEEISGETEEIDGEEDSDEDLIGEEPTEGDLEETSDDEESIETDESTGEVVDTETDDEAEDTGEETVDDNEQTIDDSDEVITEGQDQETGTNTEGMDGDSTQVSQDSESATDENVGLADSKFENNQVEGVGPTEAGSGDSDGASGDMGTSDASNPDAGTGSADTGSSDTGDSGAEASEGADTSGDV